MNTINVVVLSHIGNECLQRIESLSPLLRVKDASKLKERPSSESGGKDPSTERELADGWLRLKSFLAFGCHPISWPGFPG